jgi:hypothetical protein
MINYIFSTHFAALQWKASLLTAEEARSCVSGFPLTMCNCDHSSLMERDPDFWKI